MKKIVSRLVQPENWVQPGIVLTIILFWWLSPESWVKNPWAVTAVFVTTKVVIQSLEFFFERHADWRLDWREFLTDVFYAALMFLVISKLVIWGVDDPLKDIKNYLGISTPWVMHMPFLVQVAMVVFLIEFGQYWMHRLMHNNGFFWSLHAPHHHITQLNALKGAVGNPLELFLVSLSVVALFDFQLAAIFCAGGILTVVSSFAHANVRFNPPAWFAFLFTTIRHHSLHHSVTYEDTRCNYANSLILIDRMFGTYREGETAIVGQDERKRLSIWEQFTFPLRPLIAAIKARREQVEVAAS